MRSVVVTGASSGIGLSTARVLLAEGFRVFGGVLTRFEASETARELGQNFIPLVFDITDETGTVAAAREVRAALAGQMLAGLINNAGIAVPAQPLLSLPIEVLRRQIEVNLTGQLVVTRAFAPLLGADATYPGPPGRILMMSSIAGKIGWPFAGAYVASKHALEGLSESLRRELMPFCIDVIIIAPSVVETRIWKDADAADVERFRDSPYLEPLERVRHFVTGRPNRGLPAERVARLVLKALTARRPRVRYVIGRDPMNELLLRILPKRLFDQLITRKLRLLPRPKAD